ncbi:hypothetical protein [Schlesneria paludicola]|uniref:hypothetical protein n=1 Tax=Schlesneria paludicola TaxID=360056 RepID=UPI00029A65C1|nr:hypothetical protein [Schlesneria paludicola]
MWCPSCRAEVAAELSRDNRRMMCARCQTELGIAAAASPLTSTSTLNAETERDARELLARWSSQNMLEPSSLHSSSKHFNKSVGPVESQFQKPDLRFDAPQSLVPPPSPRSLAAFIESRNAIAAPAHSPQAVEPRERTQPVAAVPHQEAPAARAPETLAYEPARPAPRPPRPAPSEVPVAGGHDQMVRAALAQPARQRAGWMSMAGQLCAYLGVGLLTCGTVLVMWSYFGGPQHFMPTGWLTAAVGQMLLFLGVVTLISGGMEQTVAEVAWRIDHLAEEVHHLSLAIDELEDSHHQARQGTHHQTADDARREAA